MRHAHPTCRLFAVRCSLARPGQRPPTKPPSTPHRHIANANQETIGSKQPGTLAPTVLFPTPASHHQQEKPVTAHMREARDSKKATPTGLRAVSARPRRPCPGTSRPINLLVTNHIPEQKCYDACTRTLPAMQSGMHGPTAVQMISRSGRIPAVLCSSLVRDQLRDSTIVQAR